MSICCLPMMLSSRVWLIIEETIPAMRRLQDEGKVRYVGISGYPPGFLVRIAQAIPVDAILNYCRYNLLANDAGPSTHTVR